MKRVLTILLLVGATMPALSNNGWWQDWREERKAKKELKAKAKEPQVVTIYDTVWIEATKPAPEEPIIEPTAPPTDIDLGLSGEQIDSLVAEWQMLQSDATFEELRKYYINVDSVAADRVPDSVYISRLNALVSPIRLPYNDVVKSYINRYTNTTYTLMSRMLGLSQYYFPMIEDILIQEGVPVELRIVPIIESALNPTAVSPMGAAGLWQFMPSTGKHYGLEVNSMIDQRRDPVASTRAAARYLKDLHAIYNDWLLAIAAYNCGPGNVNKAIARTGGKNFWDIYYGLPRETRGYIPAFIGASYAYAYHNQHNIAPIKAPIAIAVDTIKVERIMHLGQIASTIDLPIETLRELNPQYRLDIIPATTKAYTLCIPTRNITEYIANEEAIFAKDSAYLKEYINPANVDKKRAQMAGQIYRVKSGDTLGAIALKFRVSVRQIMSWNNLKSAHKLRIGQRLRIEGR